MANKKILKGDINCSFYYALKIVLISFGEKIYYWFQFKPVKRILHNLVLNWIQ